MKKYLMVTAIAVSTLLLSNSSSFAEDITSPENQVIEKSVAAPEFKMQHKEFHKGFYKHPSKEEMAAKKAEFDKRLNLTEEQKRQIAENKKQDIEKMKPVLDEMRVKRHELRKVDFDATLSKEQKDAKKQELKSELKALRKQSDSYREENMKKFESVLDEKQKKEFSKIREEQKKEMEKRRAEFKKAKKKRGEIQLPVQPKPIPLEK